MKKFMVLSFACSLFALALLGPKSAEAHRGKCYTHTRNVDMCRGE